MTRISTFSQFQLSTADLLKTQRDMADLGRQTTSGKVAEDLKGFDGRLTSLVSSKGLLQRAEAFTAVGKELSSRFQIQADAMTRASDATGRLRAEIIGALSNDDGQMFGTALQNALDDFVGAMNAQFDGKYLFSGERVDQKPFNALTTADVVAAATTDDLFDNGTRKQVAQIDETTRIELAPLAPEFARDFIDAFKNLAAAGPFGKPLSAAATTALQTAAQTFQGAHSTISLQQGIDGARAKRVDDVALRQEGFVTILSGTVSSIEDANLTEVAIKLSSAQVQLEASATVIGQLSRMSLLELLR
jgi:flagellar hook-associated protein 3 FlgL